MKKATAKNPIAINSCIKTTHQRFVLIKSTKGLQNGFITHGRYSKPVKRAISVLDMPNLL